MKNSSKVSFDTIGRDGVDVRKDLALVTKKLGRGNQADAIRMAIRQVADNIRLSESLKVIDAAKEATQ